MAKTWTKTNLNALVAYLRTLRDPTHIPVEGKLGNQWTWWDDPQIVAEGKMVYEGWNRIPRDSIARSVMVKRALP